MYRVCQYLLLSPRTIVAKWRRVILTLSDKLVQVLLLSAQDAMLSRLILRGKAGKEERLRFGKLAFGARKAASTPDEDYMQACSVSLPCSEKRPLRVLHAC